MDLIQMFATFSLALVGDDGELIDYMGAEYQSGQNALGRAKLVAESLDSVDAINKNETQCYRRDDGWDVVVNRPAYHGLPETTETIQVRVVSN